MISLMIAATLLGAGALFVSFIDLGGVPIAFYRMAIGALLFAMILLWQGISFRIEKRVLLFAIGAGGFLGLDLAWWNIGIKLIGPGFATVLNSLQIFFMALFSYLVYKNKPHLGLWLALLLSFLGVVLFSYTEIHQSTDRLKGILISIASALAFALSMLCLREASQNKSQGLMQLMFYASIAGALLTGIPGLLLNDRFTTDLQSWGFIIVYASLIHVVAWIMMAKSLPRLSVINAGLIMILEPVVAFTMDLTLLGKSMTAWQLFGVLLTIFAVCLGGLLTNKNQTPKR